VSAVKDRVDAYWEMWERDSFLKLVEKLPAACRLTLSEHADHVAVMRVWEDRSVRITFDAVEEPRAVYITRQSEDAGRQIVWFRGGLSAWLDVLEISRDELISALVNWEEKR
jgi:hypothetical protein